MTHKISQSIDTRTLQERKTNLEAAGKTAVWIAVDGKMQGLMGIADALKPSSVEAVRKLQKLGLEVVMLTGDNRKTAQAIALEVGIIRTLAESSSEIQELTINVDGGYEPDRVVVKAGQRVRLNFFRNDPSSCLEKVLLPDFHIAQDLTLNHVTPVEFTPSKPGQYQFSCGMNMFHGVVEVQASNSSKVLD